MKNKEEKLSSLNSVLILLQQLQVKYYGKCSFFLSVYMPINIDVYINDKLRKSELFCFYAGEGVIKWTHTYQHLLDYLKKLDNEEQE